MFEIRKITLFVLLVVLIISLSSLAYAQESAKNLNWFQRIVNLVVSLFKPTAETSTTQTENATRRNLTPVTPANEPLAKPVEKINESQRRGVYINESEFYKDRVRSWSACYGFECFIPEERRGQTSIDYFKSLNLTDDFIYVIMQFDAPGGDPTVEQMNLLAADNITLFEYHGDHSYYTKAPRAILENKSYGFVRWIGIAEKASWKIYPSIKSKTFGKNCTGNLELSIVLYELPSMEQIKKLINVTDKITSKTDYSIIHAEVQVNKIKDIANLNFVKEVWQVSKLSICPDYAPNCGEDPFANITC